MLYQALLSINFPSARESWTKKEALPFVRTHASIIAGSAPNAAVTFTGIPSDPRSTMTNEEWRINAQAPTRSSSGQIPQPPACTMPAWLQAPADQAARQGAVRLLPRDRPPQGEPGQEVAAQGRQGDDHPPLQHPHEHHGDQGQALHGRQASRHPPLRHHHHRQPGGPELASRRHVYQPDRGHQSGVHQPSCPWPPAGPRGTRSPQRRHHQRKARGPRYETSFSQFCSSRSRSLFRAPSALSRDRVAGRHFSRVSRLRSSSTD